MIDDYVLITSNKISILSEIGEKYPVKILNLYKDDLTWFIAHSIEKLGGQIDCYNPDLKKIKEKNIIIFDLHVNRHFLEVIKKRYPDKRIIFWYWNAVNSISFKPTDVPEGIEIWSYVPSECAEYGMKYNTSFYSKNISLDLSRGKENYDVFYVGKAKGREAIILDIKDKLSENQISFDFHIVKNTRFQIAGPRFDKRLSYKNVLCHIAQSKSILDIYTENTDAFSVRPLESIYLNKKLITNNSKIKQCDFYCPQNVFIYGEDRIEDLRDFLAEPYAPQNKSLLEKYDVEAWIQRFDNK